MKTTHRTTRRFATLGLAALVVFMLIMLFSAASSADAAMPPGYVGSVGDKAWYFGEDFLNADRLKSIVDGWKNDPDYNFQSLKTNPVKVAVLDTGITYGHEVYDGLLLRDNAGDVIGKNTSGGAESDFADDVSNYHGTHVAGIIALMIRALGLEDYIKIIPVKAGYRVSNPLASDFGLGSFNIDAVRAGIEFALENGADVVNMSFAVQSGPASGWARLISDSYAERCVFVAAAGNKGSSSPFYPAASQNVIGVMNLSHSGKDYVLSGVSNFGNYEIAAPGSLIYSATGDNGDTAAYKLRSGTSMSSPFVAFAAAVLNVKYRALENSTEIDISPRLIRTMMGLHQSEILEHLSYQIKTMDLCSLIETDFLYDANYADQIYVRPESVEIEASADDVMLGESVNARAIIYPSNSRRDLVYSWKQTLNNEVKQLGTGKSIVFTPPPVVCSVTLTVQVTYPSGEEVLSIVANKTFSVVYLRLNSQTSAILAGDKAVNGLDLTVALAQKQIFSIKNYELAAPDSYVIWYVNGHPAAAGSNFEFSSVYAGIYTIRAKSGNEWIGEPVTVAVDDTLPFDVLEVYTPLELFTFAMITAIGLALLITIVIILVRKHRQIGF